MIRPQPNSQESMSCVVYVRILSAKQTPRSSEQQLAMITRLFALLPRSEHDSD